MPGTLMETNEGEAAPQKANPVRARFEAEAAALRAENAPGDEAQSTVAEGLTALGIDYEARPKPEEAPEAAEAPAASEEAPAAPEAPEATTEGTDALMAAMQPQDRRQDVATAIEAEARELGLSESYARFLAHNSPRKEAREVLDAERARLQSAPVAQSELPASPPAGNASPQGQDAGAHAEVVAALDGVTDDETATAVAKALAPLTARLQQLEQATTTVAQFTEQQQQASLRSQVLTAAGELEGTCPGLVRGDDVDPAVGRIAGDLLQGSFRGDLKGALEAAYGVVHRSVPTAPRQDSTATPGPEVTAPPVTPGSAPAGKIAGPQIAERIAQINSQWRNDDAKARVEIARYMDAVRAHNERVR